MLHEVFVRLSNSCWGRWRFALPSLRDTQCGVQAFSDFSSNNGTVACVFAFGWSTDGRDLVLRVGHDKGLTGQSLLSIRVETETVSSLLHRAWDLTTGGHCNPCWDCCNPVFCYLPLVRLYTIDIRLIPVQEKLFALLNSWWLFALDLRFLCWQISPSVSQKLIVSS